MILAKVQSSRFVTRPLLIASIGDFHEKHPGSCPHAAFIFKQVV
jgi:hypothetical protein